MSTVMDRDEHDLWVHTVEDLLHRYRDTTDPGQKQRYARLIDTLLAHADDLGITVTELGGIRSACCQEYLDLQSVRR